MVYVPTTIRIIGIPPRLDNYDYVMTSTPHTQPDCSIINKLADDIRKRSLPKTEWLSEFYLNKHDILSASMEACSSGIYKALVLLR